MSEFSQQEQDGIVALANAADVPFEFMANAYRNVKARYVPPGWTPAKAGYADRLLGSGRWNKRQQRAKARQ